MTAQHHEVYQIGNIHIWQEYRLGYFVIELGEILPIVLEQITVCVFNVNC